MQVQGYLALDPRQDHHRALGLLQGPRGRMFLMSEVPLWGFGASACLVLSVHRSGSRGDFLTWGH